MLKLGKNLSWDFEVIFIFRKNEVLNRARYLKRFYTYKKINNIFLKFEHSITEISVIIIPAENPIQKYNQRAYKSPWVPEIFSRL